MAGYAWEGGQVTPFAHCLICEGDDPLVMGGTNTWIVTKPGASACVVVDAGPGDYVHAERVASFCKERGLRIAAVVSTHDHYDHIGAARYVSVFADNAPVYARVYGNLPDGPFKVQGVGASFDVVSLPGHSSDSVGLFVEEDCSLLTGDVLFARSSSLVCWPDGTLSDYLASLEKLATYVRDRGVVRLLPGHGGPIEDPLERISSAHEHRMQRLNQIVSAVRSGIPADADSLVEAVYNDVPEGLARSARRNVLAQLDYAFEACLLQRRS